MTSALLVINAGSSSVKFQIFADSNDLPLLAQGKAADLGTAPYLEIARDGSKTRDDLPSRATHEDALQAILDWAAKHGGIKNLTAAGHRIAHGGEKFIKPVKITAAIIAELKKLTPLAPLHQPHNLAPVEILARLKPDLPQIACFDTAFHAGLDPLFTTYALPKVLRDKSIRRFGFHGLSYEWIVQSLRRDHPELAKTRVIAAHLGNGSSLCAMKNGESVDTTMGLTPLEGVPMGTRSGSIDPGAIIYMLRDLGMPPEKAEHCLYEESGLKGLSGLTNDVKELLQSANPRARFALDHFVLKVAQHAAMIATSLGGIDAFVFTGGIGENAVPVRAAIVQHLKFMGDFRALVISANEERIIAQHVKKTCAA